MVRTDQVSHVADYLEAAILSGQFAPGDQLPSEREICKQLDVGRSSVREALGRLTSLGLIRSVHGSGTVVESPNARVVTLGIRRLLTRPDIRLEDIAGVRLPLESAIASQAATRRTEEQLTRLEQTQAILGDPEQSLDAHVQADLDFHGTLAEATGNPLFQVVLEPIQQLLIVSRQQTLGRYGSEIACQHHARILLAVKAQDATAAAEAMRYHLQTNVQHLHDIDQSTP